MKFIKTKIEDVFIIEPSIFKDDRGYFFESFNAKYWEKEMGNVPKFIQDNESLSQKGVLRGLHFQKPPHSQGKLVRVVNGSVIDVAVDLRKNSPTYGHYEKALLSADNKKQFYVPAGFAHGFLTLEDNTIFSYKCTDFYNKGSEMGIMWNDKDLAIDWGISSPILSEKDKTHPSFAQFNSPF